MKIHYNRTMNSAAWTCDDIKLGYWIKFCEYFVPYHLEASMSKK